MNTTWNNLYETLTDRSLLRIQYLLRADGRYLLVRERDRSYGEYVSWLYQVDEWTFLADCGGIQHQQHYYGIPPNPDLILQNALGNLEFALNNTTLYERLQSVQALDYFHREEVKGIDCIQLFLRLDMGAGALHTELESQHYSDFRWVTREEAAALPDLILREQVVQLF